MTARRQPPRRPSPRRPSPRRLPAWAAATTLPSLALAVTALASAGCQCCRWTEPYLRFVDRVADSQCHIGERLYNPGNDLTRLGRPDGCTCIPNRLICPDCCRKCPPTGDAPPPIVRIYSQPTTSSDKVEEPRGGLEQRGSGTK